MNEKLTSQPACSACEGVQLLVLTALSMTIRLARWWCLPPKWCAGNQTRLTFPLPLRRDERKGIGKKARDSPRSASRERVAHPPRIEGDPTLKLLKRSRVLS